MKSHPMVAVRLATLRARAKVLLSGPLLPALFVAAYALAYLVRYPGSLACATAKGAADRLGP